MVQTSIAPLDSHTTPRTVFCSRSKEKKHQPKNKNKNKMTEYKICVLGSLGVGKSSLVIQLTQSHFIDEYDPTLEDSYRKRVCIDDEACLLDIYDAALYPCAMNDSIYRCASGFLFVYSITSRSSFEEIDGLIGGIFRVKDGNYPFVLCGNKCDLEEYRQVDKEEGEEKAKKFRGGFYETSARNRVNVEESFYDLVRMIRVILGSLPKRQRNERHNCVLS